MKSEQSQPSLTCLSSLSIMVATHTILWEDVIVVVLWLLQWGAGGPLLNDIFGGQGVNGYVLPPFGHTNLSMYE